MSELKIFVETPLEFAAPIVRAILSREVFPVRLAVVAAVWGWSKNVVVEAGHIVPDWRRVEMPGRISLLSCNGEGSLIALGPNPDQLRGMKLDGLVLITDSLDYGVKDQFLEVVYGQK